LAIDRIRSANGIYCFRFNKDILTVILRDVIYFESCGSRVHIVLKGKLYKFYKKLDDVEKEISVNYSIPFIRIHKSYAVNLFWVKEIYKEKLLLRNGVTLKIGKKYQQDVLASYKEYLLK
jgi:DNA-binding LytR/AlgR family response regulator